MGGCRRLDPIRWSSSDQADLGACRSEGFVLHEFVPDRFRQLAGQVDPSDLGAALTAEPTLRPLAAFLVVGMSSRVDGGFDERPALVLGAILRQWPTNVAAARLTDERAEAGVASELLGTREAVDIADFRRDRVGQPPAC